MHKEVRDSLADVIKDAVYTGYENNLRTPGIGAPRDTGWLRSNIYVTINSPITDTTGDKKSVDTSRRDNIAETFKNYSTDRILKTNMMYISYTTFYAQIVNDGNSNQPGQHFAERAMQDISSELMAKRKIS